MWGGSQGEEDHRLYVCVCVGGGVREKRIIGCMCVWGGGSQGEEDHRLYVCVCVWGSQGEEDHRLYVCVWGGESGRRGS